MTCTSPFVNLVLSLCLVGTTAAVVVQAQGPPAPAPPGAPAPLAIPPPDAPPPQARRPVPRVLLDVQVVIVRTQGGKVVSRLPYTLAVTTNAPEAVLNMGADVPVPTTTFTPPRPVTRAGSPQTLPTPPAGGAPPVPQPPPGEPATVPQPIQSVSYRSVGTVISCRATTTEDGQYELLLSVDDSSVLPRESAAQGPAGPGLPAFRSFRTRNTLVLRDGQAKTFTAAADRVSGEEMQVEVTMRVSK